LDKDVCAIQCGIRVVESGLN